MMTTESSSGVKGGGGGGDNANSLGSHLIEVFRSLMAWGLKLFRSLLDLDLTLRYHLLFGSRENIL
jgi:hypothetical protein